jgi:hypothetical protein
LTRNENECAEQSYRRGYQQGAFEILKALRAWEADPQIVEQVTRFVFGAVFDWRYKRKLGRHLIRDAAPRLLDRRSSAMKESA